MAQLRLAGVAKRFGDRTVLDGVDLVVGSGDRLGLVGENGSGKSTLLRVAAGADPADRGEVHRHGTVGHLPQDVAHRPGDTVATLLRSATAEVDALQAELEAVSQRISRSALDGGGTPADAQLLETYADLARELELRDAWSAPARLQVAVASLGVQDIPRERPLSTLSGGERARLALAALLVREPDLLLLDEPTTHLDDAATAFVERRLAGWRGAVLVASHDRAFLDAVATAVVDLDASRGGPATRYGGTYTDYLAAKAGERARWEQAYREWVDERSRLTRLASGQGVRVGHDDRDRRDGDKSLANLFAASTQLAVARRVKDAQVRLERLRPVAEPPAPLRFSPDLAPAAAPGGVLLSVRDAVVPGRVSVQALDVATDTRLLVTGPNGSGKSTLLGLLSGTVRPVTGHVTRAPGVRVGLLAQDLDWPDPSVNVLSAFASSREGDVDEQVAALLSVGVLRPEELSTAVGALSLGQQRRVALARLVADSPDVLLLDEPTEHLSLALVDELEEALRLRGGPLVLVSHDRWLRRRWDGTHLSLPSGSAPSRSRGGLGGR